MTEPSMDLDVLVVEVERRIRTDSGDGWVLSSHTRRLVNDAVAHGMGQAMLHFVEYASDPDGAKKLARRATDRGKDYLKRERRRREKDSRAAREFVTLAGAIYGYGSGDAAEVGLPDGADLPVLVELELEQIGRLVGALDKKQQQVVEARYWLGPPGTNLPWKEVAAHLGRSESWAKKVHGDAIRCLRDWLGVSLPPRNKALDKLFAETCTRIPT